MLGQTRRPAPVSGGVFAKLNLISDHVVDRHGFTLQKGDGTPMRQQSHFATLHLPANRRSVIAGLAYSWARQGLPMAAYAEKIRELMPMSW